MKPLSVSMLVFALSSQIAAVILPEGSPDGRYSGYVNSTGHEVVIYHGLPGENKNIELFNLTVKRGDASAGARSLEERGNGVNCGPYTGLNYQSAVDLLANWCGASRSFYGWEAFASNSGKQFPSLSHYAQVLS